VQAAEEGLEAGVGAGMLARRRMVNPGDGADALGTFSPTA